VQLAAVVGPLLLRFADGYVAGAVDRGRLLRLGPKPPPRLRHLRSVSSRPRSGRSWGACTLSAPPRRSFRGDRGWCEPTVLRLHRHACRSRVSHVIVRGGQSQRPPLLELARHGGELALDAGDAVGAELSAAGWLQASDGSSPEVVPVRGW